MLKTKVSKIVFGWATVIAFGVGSFVLTKTVIDGQRRESMKVRERMRNANTGEYELKMAGLPALNESQMKLVQDLEIEMLSDMYTRMTSSCHKKCIPTKYKDSDIAKGEAVCIDRCVAKYWEIHERVGKKLQTMSTQDEEALKKIAAEQGLIKQ